MSHSEAVPSWLERSLFGQANHICLIHLIGKRNTSRPVFTSYERALANASWTSSSARLDRDSFLPFGSCGLCLDIARDPVACPRGDIFCRECALANVLSQRKEISRVEKAQQAAKKEEGQTRAMEDEEDRERAIRDFETTQFGLQPVNKRIPPDDATADVPSNALAIAGSKRKSYFDEDEVPKFAVDDVKKARKAVEEKEVNGISYLSTFSFFLRDNINSRMVQAAKSSSPNFWTPPMTAYAPDGKSRSTDKTEKSTPICPSSRDKDLHPISMHNLVNIHFVENTVFSAQGHRTCPCCLKTLSNSWRPVMAQACGHVLCIHCVKLLYLPAEKSGSQNRMPLTCYVCDKPLVSGSIQAEKSDALLPPGLVRLQSGGTGFSARGSNTVVKSGTAFQC